ncbi:MAG: DUF1780 domain-containing protein [Sedimenticola sp.]
MDDQEILKHMQKSAREDVEYFSNSNKVGRECWVVSEFLTVLGIEHNDDELQSFEQESKVDVCFRSAQFQVKELTDPNLLRHKIYKDKFNSINAASSLEEISLIGEAHDMTPISNMYELILEKARDLANSETYKALKSRIDLLIYVTRKRASLIQVHEIKSEDFSPLGWRSVSCVNSKQAVVLHSTQVAPKFIIDKSQQLMSNNG